MSFHRVAACCPDFEKANLTAERISGRVEIRMWMDQKYVGMTHIPVRFCPFCGKRFQIAADPGG